MNLFWALWNNTQDIAHGAKNGTPISIHENSWCWRVIWVLQYSCWPHLSQKELLTASSSSALHWPLPMNLPPLFLPSSNYACSVTRTLHLWELHNQVDAVSVRLPPTTELRKRIIKVITKVCLIKASAVRCPLMEMKTGIEISCSKQRFAYCLFCCYRSSRVLVLRPSRVSLWVGSSVHGLRLKLGSPWWLSSPICCKTWGRNLLHLCIKLLPPIWVIPHIYLLFFFSMWWQLIWW